MKLRTKEASRSQLQRAQRLHRREQRSRHGQTLVEGPQAVRELLACAPRLTRDLYITDEAVERHGDVAELASAAGVWTHVLAAQDMRDLSADAQGVVAVISTPEAPDLDSLLREASLIVATLDIADPGNLGTIIRTADAAGEAAEAKILGAAPSGPDLRRRALWFVGNEARGFAGCDFDADARVAVPLYGKAESLNVSTALAVCAYASAMAQRAD